MDTTDQSPRLPTLLLAGVLTGLALAVLGWIWTVAQSPSSVWPAEKAEALKAAEAAVHEARGGDGNLRRTDDKAAADQLAAAEGRLEALEAELAHARTVRNDWGRWAAAGGLGLTIVCGLGYLALRGG